jgi:hypothetical protein
VDVTRRPGFRRRRRRRFAAWAGLSASVLVAAGAWLWVLAMPAAPGGAGPGARAGAHVGATVSEQSATHATSAVPLGVYAGPGASTAVAAVDRELQGHVEYALDFLAATSWATITQPGWLATAWHGASLRIVLGVPMLPLRGATLAQGAAGAFDAEFSLLARRLVADGLGTAVLMVGWQPDDEGQSWYVGTEAAARDYVRYWDRIHKAMAAVPGARFRYEWDAGDGGTSPLSPAAMYPGNAAVDLVATDAFDHVATVRPVVTRWQAVADERYGPAWMASFAAAEHKPMAIAMWGEMPVRSGGDGDDPRFVRSLLSWAASAGVTMCVLWDYGSSALTGGGYPAADTALAAAVAQPSGTAPPTTVARAGTVRRGTDGGGTGPPYGRRG